MEPRRMLTDAEIDGLPDEVRDWYRANDGLRHHKDLPLMPARVREAFGRLTERSRDDVVARIAERKAS